MGTEWLASRPEEKSGFGPLQRVGHCRESEPARGQATWQMQVVAQAR